MSARRSLATLLGATAIAGCSVVLGIDADYVEDPQAGALAAEGGLDGGKSSADGEAGPCSGHLCNGICLPGTACDDCKGAPLFCDETHACVSACASCDGGSVECWTCKPSPSGSCHSERDAYCLRSTYTRCPCDDGGVAQCPGQSQVCTSDRCETCGYWGTGGKTCKSGPACSSSSKSCGN